MSDTTSSNDTPAFEAISLGARLASSGGFMVLYREGMALVEQTAEYLDSAGRKESADLPRESSMLYGAESMRLTTRLMQLASWLLLQRAVNDGEISASYAYEEKQKVTFSPSPSARGGPGWSELPDTLRALIARGDVLFDRVVKLDKLDRGQVDATSDATNHVGQQMNMLRAAFARD